MRKPPFAPKRGTPVRSPADLLQEGLQLHQAGLPEEGALRYRQVLAAEPEHAAANHLLGLVHLQQGNHQLAIDHIALAIAARPDDPQYLGNLGVALNGAGRHEEAVVALRRATTANVTFAEAYSNLGMALRALHRADEAVAAYTRAVELKPREPGFRYNLGNALVDAGYLVEAEAAYREAVRLRPNYAGAVNALAAILRVHGKSAEALELVDAALAASPADPQLHLQQGRLLGQLGRVEDAVAAYSRAVNLRPGFGEAHFQRALARRHETRDAELAAMETLFANPEAPLDDRVFAGFGLGKVLADIGSHDASVGVYLAVNRMHRSRISFSLERATAGQAQDLERFSGISLSGRRMPDDKPGPIFVVGLPRAGKSTVEAILSRHAGVGAAGELPTLGRLASQLVREQAGGAGVPPERLAELRQAYLDEARRFVPAGQIVVDTMPSNYRHIGLIRAAFPGARVIWCHRDAASHCIAIFEKYLTGAGYEYAYDLDELVPFHAAYRELATAWMAKAPDLIQEVDIAQLRSSPSAEIRNLLNFCGLYGGERLLADVETEPQLGDWDADRIARNQAEHSAAWYRAAPALAALHR